MHAHWVRVIVNDRLIYSISNYIVGRAGGLGGGGFNSLKQKFGGLSPPRFSAENIANAAV